ncbi:MAG: right-handed parallel beta-helix repeat-containing protein [Promethearchaeota archaeon]
MRSKQLNRSIFYRTYNQYYVKIKKGLVVIILIPILILFSNFLIGLNETLQISAQSEIQYFYACLEISAGVEHPSMIIDIDGNAELDAFSLKSGSGTAEDPYIIQNFIINGGQSNSCISIKNTDRYLILQNMQIYNSSDAPDACLYLYNVSHISVVNCKVNNTNLNGVLAIIDYCSDIVLERNYFQNYSYDGVRITNSMNCWVNNNTFSNWYGGFISNGALYLFNSSNIYIQFNKFEDVVHYGLNFYSTSVNTIENNLFKGNYANAVKLRKSTFISISNNDINDAFGVAIDISLNSYNNTISNNLIKNISQSGISIFDSDNCIIRANEIEECKYGLSINLGRNSMITYNKIKFHENSSVKVSNSDGSTIMWNYISHSDTGIEISDKNSNFNIYYNWIYLNTYTINESGVETSKYNVLNCFVSPYYNDEDKDSLIDNKELELGTSPFYEDTDSDELNDNLEILMGCNATNPDSDGDTYLDGVEIKLGYDPLDPTSHPLGVSELSHYKLLISILAVLLSIIVVFIIAISIIIVKKMKVIQRGINFERFNKEKAVDTENNQNQNKISKKGMKSAK